MHKHMRIWLALLWMAALALPDAAWAQFALQPAVPQPFQPIAADGTVCPVASGIASRIVMCVHDTVYWAVTAFLLPFSAAMGKAVSAVCLLAVIMMGYKMMAGGVQRLAAETVVLAIKLSCVIIFTWNFGGWFPVLISIMDWLVNTATSYVITSQTLSCPFAMDAWQRVDCALDKLIGGVLPGSTLLSGLVGFLVGCIFSGPVGFSLFLMGLAFFGMMTLSLFKAAYIYLSAFIALTLLVCISPLIIPLVLLQATYQYFERWLRLLFSFMLQPLFLFAYLSLLLAAMDIVVFSGPRSLYATIAGPVWAAQGNFRIGNYVNGTGGFVQRSDLGEISVMMNPAPQAAGIANPKMVDMGILGNMREVAQGVAGQVQGQIGKNIGMHANVQAVDMNRLARAYYNVPISCDNPPINCELQTSYVINVLLSLLTAGVMAYLFYIMIDHIPYVGVVNPGMGHVGQTMAPYLGQAFDKGIAGMKEKLGGEKPAGVQEKGIGEFFGIDKPLRLGERWGRRR